MPKDIELRSADVQEVMNHIPSTILRCGTTIITFIIVILLCITYYVKVPISKECEFSLILDDRSNTPKITVIIPPDIIQTIISGHKNITLHSKAFPDRFNGVCQANIVSVSKTPLPDGNYIASAESSTLTSKRDIVEINGKAYVTIEDKTLLQYIFCKIQNY